MSGADLEFARMRAAAGLTATSSPADGARLEQLADQREAVLDLLFTGNIISVDTDGVPYLGTVDADITTAVAIKQDTDGVYYFLMGP